MSDQNREGQPESIPAPEPVVDSAFDAIPGASQASSDPSSDAVTPPAPPAPPTADPAAAAAQPPFPTGPDAPVPPAQPGYAGTPVPPPAPPAAPQGYPGAGAYPGAGQQPPAYPGAPAYPAQPYGAGPTPATARPRHVISACVLAWVIAGLGVIGLLGALALMSQYGVDGAYLAGALFIPVLTIIGLAVFAVFTWQGKSWARIALTVMFAINTLGGLANVGNGVPQAILGVILSIAAIVLLWLPASNAWFAAKRQRA